MKKRILIIGGGLSGLSSAIYLAAEGHQVAILEQNKRVGGQINRINKGDFTIDIDMNIFTMPETLADLFTSAGKNVNEYLTFDPIEPQWKTFFQDGLSIDFTNDPEEWAKQISSAELFQEYLNLCRKMHFLVQEQVNPQPNSLSWFQRIKKNFQRIPKQSVRELHQHFLKESHLEQIFNYFTMFEGRSADQASVAYTLHMIYSQLNKGLYTIHGGSYHMIEMLVHILYELGVEIHTESTVSKILTECYEVVGVELTDGTQLPADMILSSLDPLTTYQQLLAHYTNQPKMINKLPDAKPSLSGHILLLHVNQVYDQLSQQNLFFSADSDQELNDLFTKHQPAQDPTLLVHLPYVHQQKQTTNQQTLAIFSHVPALKENETWDLYRKSFYTAYRRSVITKLEQMGLTHLERNILWELEITPDELKQQLGSTGGSLYGVRPTQSQKLKTSLPYKAKGIYSLYFIGNSVSYGNSIPMILLSSKYITKQIKREIEKS